MYKYSELKKDFKILTWQWKELNGVHEEYKIMKKEKRKSDMLIKERGLHRQDPFYPDEDEEEEEKEEEDNNNGNHLNFFNQNQEDDEDDDDDEEEDN